jgi:hypothetical protein
MYFCQSGDSLMGVYFSITKYNIFNLLQVNINIKITRFYPKYQYDLIDKYYIDFIQSINDMY